MDLAALVVLQRVRELAEAPGEGHLLQVIERLAAKEQDRMLVPRALDVPKERTVHRLRELHIEHLRADRRRELSVISRERPPDHGSLIHPWEHKS